MAYDCIILGGDLIDGTGSEAVRADVAIDGERIAAVGALGDADAKRVIDATGKIVTPGFVDLHTHFDAQVGWDPQLRSSSWHGITTVLMGNCGVTFAPVKPEDHGYLAALMESVEDIPAHAIRAGLPWTWQTYGEYLDTVRDLRPSLNIAGFVGHCPVRYAAMGDAACDEDAHPDERQLREMAECVGQAIADGAAGFSTSRLLVHRVPDGRRVPGTYAKLAEYEAILAQVMEAGGGMFQAVLNLKDLATEKAILARAAEMGCQVLFSGGAAKARHSESWGEFFEQVEAAGGKIASVAQVRPSGSLIGLAGVGPVSGKEWAQFLKSSPTLEGRLAQLEQPEVRERLIAEGKQKGLWFDPRSIFPLGTGEVPQYSDDCHGSSVADLAADAGTSPIEVIIDRWLRTQGREWFNVHVFSPTREGIDSFTALPQVIPGINDSGAHATQINDADSFTYWLSERVRDRAERPLPEAIRKITSQPAQVLGLIDRGTIAAGKFADINVIDYERLATRQPEMAHEFPNGAPHLIVRGHGYAATFVNGEPILIDDELTGARPGQVQRHFTR